MEQLALQARDDAQREILAVCGKVGGYQFYVVRDADASNLLVSLASLVGKWVRDTFTRRVVAYHTHHSDFPTGAPTHVSGYHDPRTKAFVEATRLVRRRQNIEALCFERTAASR